MFNSTITYENVLQPLHSIDPSKKGKDWCRDYSRYIYGRRIIDDNIKFLRSFADGRQSSKRYQTILDDYTAETPNTTSNPKYTRDENNNDQHTREGYMHVNYEDKFNPAPVYISSYLGIMEEQDHKIVAFAQNENAGDERETMEYMSLVKKDFGEWADTVKKMMGLQTDNEEIIPKSLDEFKMFQMMGAFKLPYEIALEKGIDFSFEYSNWREVRRKILRDLFILNKACAIDKIDPTTRLNKIEYVDVDDVIVEYNNSDNFDKTSFFSYVKYYSIQELRNINPSMTEEDMIGIAKKYSGLLGNASLSEPYEKNEYGGWNFDRYRIPVLHSFWLSTDTNYKTIRKKGDSFIEVDEPYRTTTRPPKLRNNENQKTDKHDKITVYQCSWVVDTDFVFDYGKMYNQSYDFKNKTPKLPCHLFKIEGKSKLESMIPVLDLIEMTYLKLQNDIAVQPPSNSMRIDLNALKSVTLGNKKWDELDLIRLYTSTGKMLYKGQTGGTPNPMMGNATPSIPIEAIPQNYQYITAHTNTFEMCFHQLSVLTGIDQFTMASKTPASGTTATGINVASAATSNTLRPLYFGLLQIQQSVAYSIGYRIQLQLLVDPVAKNKYTSILGRPLVDALIVSAEKEPIELGIKIEPMPTEQLKGEIRQAAMAALQNTNGGIPTITYSEYLFVTTELFINGNMNYIRAWLMQREALAEQKRNEFAKMNVQQQSEAQAQAKIVMEEETRKTELLKSNLTIRENYLKALYEASFKAVLDNTDKLSEVQAITLDPSVMASFEPQQEQVQQPEQMQEQQVQEPITQE